MMKPSTASTNSGLRRRGFKVVMILTLILVLGSIGPASFGPQDVMAQDPDNSAWQQLPDMAQRRWEPGTVVLDELLYVFGGYTNRPEPGPKSIKHVDVFDPKDNSWRQLADLPSAITHFNAVLDGRTVWFAGGFKDGYKGHTIAEVWNYDIDKNTYTAGPDLPEQRAAGGLALVGRKLHYISGLKADRDTDARDHWVLDLEDTSKGWTNAAPMPEARNQFSVVTFDGKIYAIGGQFNHDSRQLDQARVDIYDPETDTWSGGPPLPHGHSHGEASTFVHGGRIYMAGGHATPAGGRKKIDDNILALTPGGQWKVVGHLPMALSSPAAVIIGDKLYVGGGSPNGGRVQPKMWVAIAP